MSLLDRLPNWPALMSAKLAALYLDMGETAFRSLGIAPVRPFGPEADRKWRKTDLDRWADGLAPDHENRSRVFGPRAGGADLRASRSEIVRPGARQGPSWRSWRHTQTRP